ncbi:hypothetical protein E8E13_001784 [Curvularia kusanoi]|uniref:Uncharacterized protein n=1 Tax=Curvularia kusanoi TaxID=90978 RepID=A0A9P4T4T7_CURKU|nr:hypothetical protein E8E13_001784 [Curvularia kusanoi]
MSAPTSPFLALPIELRYAIYDRLCLSDFQSYPYTQPSPIAAIDTTKPPRSLLLVNHTIHSEISTYYFARCTFRFIAQGLSNPNNISNITKMPVGSQNVIRQMRKAELLLIPGRTMAPLSTPLPYLGTRGMSGLWLARHVRLLRDEALELRIVVVSVRKVSWNTEWSMREEMEALLKALEELAGKVEFRLGEVMGPTGTEKDMRDELGVALDKLNGQSV